MASKTILSIACEFDHPDVAPARFRSSVSLFDYQVAIVDPAAALSEYRAEAWTPTYMGLTSLDDDDSVNLVRDIARRRSEILEFVNLGRAVVVLVPPPTECYVATGALEHSGTGRNRQTTRMVRRESLGNAIPAKFSTKAGRGRSISYVGPKALAGFWQRTKDWLEYRAVFDVVPGKPVMEVSGTAKVVASVLSTDSGGVMLFLPHLDDSRLTIASTRRAHRGFIDGLAEALSDLRPGAETLPTWTSELLVPKEVELAAVLQESETAIAEQLARRDATQAELDGVRRLKYLVSGTCTQLEAAARAAFEALGAATDAPAGRRTDLRLTAAGRTAVVEIKGKGGSAAEADAAQLEKWVAEEVELGGDRPKAILLVNGFRNDPMTTRSIDVFPDQMIDYSTKREHCLIAGWQLLAAYWEATRHREAAPDIVREILDTSGRFTRYTSWRAAIETPPETNPGAATTEVRPSTRRRRNAIPDTSGETF